MLELQVLFSASVEDIHVLFDANEAFSRMKVEDTPYNRRALKYIDGATYKSPLQFIDRFGNLQPIYNLSTGCRIALLLGTGWSERIDLRECGWNARDFIVCNCVTGKALLADPGVTICDVTPSRNGAIDVSLDGQRFTSLSALNDYIFRGLHDVSH